MLHALTTGPYLLILVVGVLVVLSLVAGLYSSRWGFSHLLVFLLVGMLAGVDGPLGLPFEDYGLSFVVGNLALATILLDGGLRTPMRAVRMAWAPASLLATAGVALTAAGVMAAGVAVLGMDWRQGLLLGAILASTDAAAVFTQLSSSGVKLPERLSSTIELESGLNDPMAVLMTLSMVSVLAPQTAGGDAAPWVELVARQIGFGLGIGLAAGRACAAVLNRLPLAEDHEGLTALLLAALGTAVYAAASLVEGSGFLAIYVFGIVMADRAGARVRPALFALNGYTWLAEALMFLLLGLLVTPHEVGRFIAPALAVAAVLMLLARPLAVVLCLAPFGFAWREQLFVGWVGLRGGVPIVLALYPVLAGLPQAYLYFDVAFVVVLCSLLVQAPSLRRAAHLAGMDGVAGHHPPMPVTARSTRSA